MGYSKSIKILGQEAAVSKAVNNCVDVITSTMGPGGHVAIIQSEFGTMSTKDGVTVSKYIAPRDTFERMISQLVVDAANRTVKEVGDGTTTTACLLGAMYDLWCSDYNKMAGDKLEFLDGMNNAVEDVLALLKENALEIVENRKVSTEKLMNVAMISCNGDKDIAGMLSDLIAQVGEKGRVMIKKNVGTSTYTEHIPGYTFDTLLLGRHHLKDRSEGDIVLHKPLFVLAAENMESADNHVMKIIDTWLSSVELKSENNGLRPLVIVTTGLVGSARTFVSSNAEAYPIYVVQMPLGGKEGYEIMTDIKDMTGTHRVYNKQIGGRGLVDFGEEFEEEDSSVYSMAWREFGSVNIVVRGE
jgi:chaperonin GroEL